MNILIKGSSDYRHVSTFPKRRSSDLLVRGIARRRPVEERGDVGERPGAAEVRVEEAVGPQHLQLRAPLQHVLTGPRPRHRSEEHTSERQSQSNLVCRLLLEKKKIKIL